MLRGPAARASALALAVASAAVLGLTAPTHPATTTLLSCTVSAREHFSPGVLMTAAPQSVSGDLGISGQACGNAVNGITGLVATFTGSGQATCLTDPVLTTVNLSGDMTITWKKAGGAAAGSSSISWTAKSVELGNVTLAGSITSGLFKGATMSVAGLSAAAVISVSGGCRTDSPLTGVRTTDTYLRLTSG